MGSWSDYLKTASDALDGAGRAFVKACSQSEKAVTATLHEVETKLGQLVHDVVEARPPSAPVARVNPPVTSPAPPPPRSMPLLGFHSAPKIFANSKLGWVGAMLSGVTACGGKMMPDDRVQSRPDGRRTEGTVTNPVTGKPVAASVVDEVKEVAIVDSRVEISTCPGTGELNSFGKRSHYAVPITDKGFQLDCDDNRQIPLDHKWDDEQCLPTGPMLLDVHTPAGFELKLVDHQYTESCALPDATPEEVAAGAVTRCQHYDLTIKPDADLRRSEVGHALSRDLFQEYLKLWCNGGLDRHD